jgi:hypothetical protein
VTVNRVALLSLDDSESALCRVTFATLRSANDHQTIIATRMMLETKPAA